MVAELHFGNDLNQTFLIHFINMGYGSCVLIQTPSFENIVILGSLERVGFSYIQTYFQSFGIYPHRIDLLILPNPFSDPCSDFQDLINYFMVETKNLWIPPLNPYCMTNNRSHEFYKKLFINATGVMAGVERELKEVTIRVLTPFIEDASRFLFGPQSAEEEKKDFVNYSLNLEFEFKKGKTIYSRMLFLTDLTDHGWVQFFQRYSFPQVDLIHFSGQYNYQNFPPFEKIEQIPIKPAYFMLLPEIPIDKLSPKEKLIQDHCQNMIRARINALPDLRAPKNFMNGGLYSFLNSPIIIDSILPLPKTVEFPAEQHAQPQPLVQPQSQDQTSPMPRDFPDAYFFYLMPPTKDYPHGFIFPEEAFFLIQPYEKELPPEFRKIAKPDYRIIGEKYLL